jgi:hypothetical protein
LRVGGSAAVRSKNASKTANQSHVKQRCRFLALTATRQAQPLLDYYRLLIRWHTLRRLVDLNKSANSAIALCAS